MHGERVTLDALTKGDWRLIVVFLEEELTLVDLLRLVHFATHGKAFRLDRLLAEVGASLEAQATDVVDVDVKREFMVFDSLSVFKWAKPLPLFERDRCRREIWLSLVQDAETFLVLAQLIAWVGDRLD